MKTIRFLLLTLLVPVVLPAQDARFSQYFNNPLVLNPALAGNGIEYIRVTAIYRNQWAGMGTPFTTQGFAIDKTVNRVGLGAFITRNGAGDGSIRTINFAGNLSYHLPVKKSTLSGGIQLGMVSKSFDPNKLTFDNQYNPDAGYDPNMSSGEEFIQTSVIRPDVNAGLMWQRGWMKPDVRFRPFAGIGYAHMTQPGETFIFDIARAQPKTTLYGGAGFQVSDKTEIRPSAMLLNQGHNQETTFGTLVNYQFDSHNQFQLGAFHRMNDAVIAYAGYQMSRWFVGMSYDLNTSELSTSGKGTNAFELSLTFSPRPKPKKTPVKTETKIQPRADKIQPVEKRELVPAYIAIPDQLEQRPVAQTAPAPVQKKSETPVVKKPEPAAVVPAAVVPAAVAPAIAAETPKMTDADKDGIMDADDACPYINGSAATKGCPDSDGDGIPNQKDKCPMESGSAANYGCPDPNVPVKSNQHLVKKYDNILFATGKTKMTTDDIYDIIERAIDIMYADKSLKVVLSGHTDSEGDAYNNMNLSQARADIVKSYMIRQGIDASRIETVAYGETMPLENNQLREGKRQNRRVEINIVK